jgi:hypothetical protein
MAEWDAFISYSSADVAVAARVQRALERYRLPDGRRLRVYRDETDIAGGELPGQLSGALANSRALVVCCSEAAAASRWVELEIEAFREAAPERPVLSVLVADEPPRNLPRALGAESTRWADLRPGWRLGLPRRSTRVELVRVVAGVAGIEFRELLPLDRRRRRRRMLTAAASVVALLAASAWIPVQDWIDVTPTRTQVFHCDQLDDGIAWFILNEPYSIKSIVTVARAVLPAGDDMVVDGHLLDRDLVPRGRLLPTRIADGVRVHCGGGTTWVGEPEAGLCVGVTESEETEFFADPMGGFDAPVTDVVVGDGPAFTLPVMWRRLDLDAWREQYGVRMTPSAGLPVAADGDDLWLGLPQSESTPGSLWHTADRGGSWEAVPRITDVRSVRRLDIGLLAAARRDRELGFWLLRDSAAVPFDVPGKGDDLEVCGQVNGQPVIRADRTAYRSARRPWWRTVVR